jgi:tetratricopeptide (TPR) repeat protein
MDKMTIRREAVRFSYLCLALCAVVAAGQVPTATLSPQEIFKRVSPSVMVVESLDAKGSVTAFGSGVVICGGCGLGNPPKTLQPNSFKSDRVVTNRHVIKGGVSFKVEHNGKTWPAKLVRVDSDHDLAELSVAGLTSPFVRVRESSTLAVGEKVYSIGAPEGFELTISEGLISGLRNFDKDRVIQTSAAISHGSSGGGLFDAEGGLVGITTFFLKEGQSLNFALPAEWTLALDRQPANAAPAGSQDSPAFQALVWNEVGYKAYQAGKHDQAVSALLEAVRLKPDYATAWNNLGAAYRSLGQYQQAISSEQEAIRLEPDDPEPWNNLGSAYLGLGQYDRAISAEQKAVGLKPDYAGAWDNLGVAYGHLGQYHEAISALQESTRLKPDSAEAWVSLGSVYADLGQYEQVISAEQEATRLKPDLANTWYNLGTAYAHLGKYHEAVSALEEATRLKPDFVEAWHNLGHAHNILGKYHEAVSALQEAIRLKPDFAEAWNNLGFAYLGLGQYDQAVSAEQEAVRLKPDSAEDWYALGWAYNLQGQRSEVTRVYERLKTLDTKLAEKFFQDVVK